MVFTPFIESPTVRTTPVASGGMDTSGFDAYRQGVEILNASQRYRNVLKISAGPDDHQLVQTEFGQLGPFEVTEPFRDQDLYDPVEYIEAGGDVPQPIVVGVTDLLPNGLLDGIIEPLIIRDEITFSSTEVPFFSRVIRADYMGGNGDREFGHDTIGQIHDLRDRRPGHAFIDSDDTLGTVQFVGLSSDIVAESIDYDDVRNQRIEPGRDNSFELGAATVYGGDPLRYAGDVEIREKQLAARQGVSSSTDTGLLSYTEISAQAGFVYEPPKQKVVIETTFFVEEGIDAIVYRFVPPFDYGTDSIAFGGKLQ